ncbi:MAG: Hsp70 family protein [Halocynthiibacter sp.]
MIIGIDLGTTNSLVSVFRDGKSELIPNALGAMMTPSVVHFTDKSEAMIGSAAKSRLVTDPQQTFARFKRHMGTEQIVRHNRKKFSPEDLSAFVLRNLKADAESFLGTDVTEAVISVPAYFNDVQRKATITAAELAGLSVRRLINEPTAAALAYGLNDRDGESTFLVVDLGGGTFDVSILEMFSGVMEVRSSAGDAFLGGEDFTDRITEEFAKTLKLKTKDMSAEDLSRLRSVADQAKHNLSDTHEATVTFRQKKEEKTLSLTREKFEELTADLLTRMRLPLQRAISDAGLNASQIDRIVLVGGATRMALVRNLITKLFRRFPEYDLDPDTVVALGAGVQAGLVARNAALDDMVMTDVCPFTLGYETSQRHGEHGPIENGLFSPLIERNTTIPVSRNHVIETMQKGQSRIAINIFQGEAPYVRDNIRIGSYNVQIPTNHIEHEKVDVRFTYDNSGVLEVISTVKSTGKSTKLIIESNPGSLSTKDIEARFKELENIKIHPRDEAASQELLSRLSMAYQNALGDKRMYVGGMLSEFERALVSFDKRQIEDTRVKLKDQLEALEGQGVFD